MYLAFADMFFLPKYYIFYIMYLKNLFKIHFVCSFMGIIFPFFLRDEIF